MSTQINDYLTKYHKSNSSTIVKDIEDLYIENLIDYKASFDNFQQEYANSINYKDLIQRFLNYNFNSISFFSIKKNIFLTKHSKVNTVTIQFDILGYSPSMSCIKCGIVLELSNIYEIFTLTLNGTTVVERDELELISKFSPETNQKIHNKYIEFMDHIEDMTSKPWCDIINIYV